VVPRPRIVEVICLVDEIQRIYDGGWDPSGDSGNSKSEQVKHCMDLGHCYTCYTWSLLT
jgi:hypothetical protein